MYVNNFYKFFFFEELLLLHLQKFPAQIQQQNQMFDEFFLIENMFDLSLWHLTKTPGEATLLCY